MTLSDLPLFTKAHIMKMRYRNDAEFREKQIAKARKWKKKNPEKNIAMLKKWAEQNPDKAKAARRRAEKKKMENPSNRVMCNLRKRLRDVLKGRKGFSKTAVIKGIGCTRDELKAHLESLFQTGMSWDNYGEWHIDHIIPLASAKVDCFDQTIANLTRLNHYTNLQPLWAADNLAKGDSMGDMGRGGYRFFLPPGDAGRKDHRL